MSRFQGSAPVLAAVAALGCCGAFWLANQGTRRRRRNTSVYVEEAAARSQRGRRGRPEVVLLGDSHTQFGFDVSVRGWAAQLSTWYERRVDVINRGYRGYNTRWILFLLETIFPNSIEGVVESPPAALVVVFMGSNDMALPTDSCKQGIPLQEYRSNLKRIVAHIREAEAGARIVLITPPPVHEAKWAVQQREFLKAVVTQGDDPNPPLNRTVRQAATYAKACIDAANEMMIPCVDAFGAFGAGDQDSLEPYLSDGLHMSASGNDLLFSLLVDTIKRFYPALVPENFKMHAPPWQSIDPKRPEKALEHA